MKKNIFPTGWNEEKVRHVLAHYESQTDADAILEDETAFSDDSQTIIEIPNELVPLVRELIAKYQQNVLNIKLNPA